MKYYLVHFSNGATMTIGYELAENEDEAKTLAIEGIARCCGCKPEDVCDVVKVETFYRG